MAFSRIVHVVSVALRCAPHKPWLQPLLPRRPQAPVQPQARGAPAGGCLAPHAGRAQRLKV